MSRRRKKVKKKNRKTIWIIEGFLFIILISLLALIKIWNPLEKRSIEERKEEISKLLQYALKNKTFNKIFQARKYSVPPTNQHSNGFTFYSSMFKLRDEWKLNNGEILGGKTGYTEEAGLCLASEAIVNEQKYIAITVKADGNHDTEPFHVYDAFYLYNQLELK